MRGSVGRYKEVRFLMAVKGPLSHQGSLCDSLGENAMITLAHLHRRDQRPEAGDLSLPFLKRKDKGRAEGDLRKGANPSSTPEMLSDR